MTPDYLYHYSALVVGVYDGDTITCDIDLGFEIWPLDMNVPKDGPLLVDSRGVPVSTNEA